MRRFDEPDDAAVLARIFGDILLFSPLFSLIIILLYWLAVRCGLVPAS